MNAPSKEGEFPRFGADSPWGMAVQVILKRGVHETTPQVESFDGVDDDFLERLVEQPARIPSSMLKVARVMRPFSQASEIESYSPPGFRLDRLSTSAHSCMVRA